MRLAATVTVIATLAGCSRSRESQLLGTWKPRASSVAANTMQGAPGAGSAEAAAGGAVAMAMMSLDFREDKTFTLTVGAPMEGTWTMDEESGVANMTVTKIAGKDITTMGGATPTAPMKIVCQLDDATSTLTLNNPDKNAAAGGLSALNFEKAS